MVDRFCILDLLFEDFNDFYDFVESISCERLQRLVKFVVRAHAGSQIFSVNNLEAAFLSMYGFCTKPSRAQITNVIAHI